MALKAGQRGVLQLGSSFEDPKWREALILKVEGKWLRTLVRCSAEEIVTTGLTSVEHLGATFCLVEAESRHLQLGTHEEFKKLSADPKALLELGKTALESGDEELQFASAVEAQAPGAPKSKKNKKEIEESSSSGSVSEEEMDPLEEFRKTWLGDGTSSAKKGKKSERASKSKSSKRFALIEDRKSKKESEDEELNTTKAMLRAAAASSDPLHGLLALQISQGMQGRKKHERRKRSSRQEERSSSASASSSSSSSPSARRGERGYAKAVRGYHNEGRKKFKNPLRYVKRYVRNLEEEMGAQDRPFKITDHNRKIHFGKQQDLKRAHFLVGTILEFLLKKDFNGAALQSTLTLQAMHQAALDNSWEVAWLLTHLEDPFRPRTYGGDPESLQHVTSYLKSMSELAKNADQLRKKGSSKGEGDDQQQAAKGKGRSHPKKDKDKEKEKQGDN